ncbi:MAG: hypothetical protein J7L38_00750 [Thermoproteales archaeon]|nr:hypothetical protein [Thermoproteales archaeon]
MGKQDIDVDSKYFDVHVEDGSNNILSNRVSTLKLKIINKSDRSFEGIYISPPRTLLDQRLVRGLVDRLEVMWGGGRREGYLLMLPGDRDEIRPSESVIAYFFLYYPYRQGMEVTLPLHIHDRREVFGSVRIPISVHPFNLEGYIYRPRYKPMLHGGMRSEVKKIIEHYGVPEIKTFIWQLIPRVHVFFDEREIAVVSGDLGSGLRHVSGINIKNDLFIGKASDLEGRKRWYWVVRVWFFWLNKNIFDEVPDVERIELWVNPDNLTIDWLITDRHWREVVFRGPVKKAKIKIVGGAFTHLDRIVRSYHPPIPVNMREAAVTPDPRNPNAVIQSIYDV